VTGPSTGATSGRVAAQAALLFFCLSLTMGIFAAEAKPRKDKLTLHTASGAHVIEIEVVESEADKALGLMYRSKVPPNTGMLFPYGKPQELTMWMRNTYASLDMIFINADGTVHRIEHRTEPLSEHIIASNGPVVAVLELAAGEASRLAVKPGDRVQHATFKSRK
jgi:uncharacterized membrane protein (UPF0127 family)